MAKDTRPQKATEATKKDSSESGPAEASRDAELLEGANATALVKALSLKLDANADKTEKRLKRVDEGLSLVLAKVPDPPDAKKVEARAFEMFTKLRQTDWRVFLWQSERREAEHKDSKYHLPRPSVVGRALHDLGAFGKTHWQVAGEIFQEIQAKGPDHLNDLIKTYLTNYVDSDGIKDKDIAGKLKKQLTPRLELLLRRAWVDTGGKGCWLTPRGKELFDGWPDYRVQDDDFECLGELIAASPPITAKSKPIPPAKPAAATPKP
jgi:hypothetical protein